MKDVGTSQRSVLFLVVPCDQWENLLVLINMLPLIVFVIFLLECAQCFPDPDQFPIRNRPFPGYLYPQNNPLWDTPFEREDQFVQVETSKGLVTGQVVRLFDGPGREWDRKQQYTTTPWIPWLNVTVFNFLVPLK